MTTYAQLDTDSRDSIRAFLRSRPFTSEAREYYRLCWLQVTQAQVDSINALMPTNHRCAARDLNGQLLINVDLISDAIDGGWLSAIKDILETLTWQYVNPWEWPQTDEDGNPVEPTPEPQEPETPWVAGESVAMGDRRSYGDHNWMCIQNHTTQADWTPDTVPALWFKITPPPAAGEYTVWDTGLQVSVGDQLWYPDVDTTLYRVLQSHTTQAGWTPPAVPALWEEVV